MTNPDSASVNLTKQALAAWNERYIDVDGVHTRYVLEGSGPPVLLIHGFGEFLEVWHYNIAPLSEHFSVYAMDLPGHGLSGELSSNYTLDFSSEFIVHFMQAMGIKHASLVGHSLGGLLCLSVAINFPSKVDKLILVDSAGLNREAPLIYRLATLPVFGEIILKPTLRTVVRAGMKKGFYDPNIITRDWIDLSYRYLRQPKLKHAILNLVRNNASIDGLHPELLVTDKLHLVTASTMLIHGEQDQVIPVEYARLACKLIPNVTCRIFEKCGHCPHIEKAGKFNEALIGFLNS